MYLACQDSSLAFQLQAEEQTQWRGSPGYRLTQGQRLKNIQHERGEAGSTSWLADISDSTIIKREAGRHPEPTFFSTSHSTVQSTHRPSYLHRINNAHFLAEVTKGKTWIQSLKKPEPKQIKKHKANPHPLWRVEPELDLIFMPSCEAHDRKLFLWQVEPVLHKEGRGQGLVVPVSSGRLLVGFCWQN